MLLIQFLFAITNKINAAAVTNIDIHYHQHTFKKQFVTDMLSNVLHKGML